MKRLKLLLLLFVALSHFSFKAQILDNIPSDPKPPSFRQLGSCPPGCLTCSNSEVCTNCEAHRTILNGKCRCEPPRILLGASCECPWYMNENPVAHDCEYIDLIDVAYQSIVSPLFDAVFQAQINPKLKWAAPPTFTWTFNCNFENTETQDQINTYLSTQQSDLLIIPSSFLEYNFQCDVKVSYINQNSLEISKGFAFTTSSYFQPQVRIVGGAFQIFNHADSNLIIAEVVSLTGSPIFASDLKITWTQPSGKEKLDMTQLSSSSSPLRLTIPKCTLSPGKLYTVRVNVQVGLNPILASQEVTIGVYAPKIDLKPINTETYHIYSQDLKLIASQFSVEDECKQGLLPTDFLDLSTLKYTWECVIVDLHDTSRRLISTETTDITNDLNVITHPDPQHLFYRSTSSKTLTIPNSYFAQYQDSQFIFYLTATVKSTIPTPSLASFNLLQPTLHTIQTKAYIQIATSKPFTTISFNCVNENNCQTFSDESTQFVSSNYNPKLTYTWIVNMFSGSKVDSIYKNWMTVIRANSNPNQKIVPQIILKVTDGNNIASSFFTMPLRTPIETGSIYIYPTEGEAYNTNFFARTYLSKDDDLPVTFQFFTNCATDTNYMLQKYEPYDETPLLLPPLNIGCQIGVLLTESLGYSISISKGVPLTGRLTSLKEALERGYLAMDSSRSSSNIYQRLRLISLILQNLQAWESSYYPPDETMNVTSSQFKYSAISELRDISLALGSRDDMKGIMLKNIQWASEQLFNEDRNWRLYMSIIDSFSDLLNPEEYRTFGAILDNLIYYMKKPGNGIVDPEKVFNYANVLSKSALSRLYPSDDGFNCEGVFYAMFTIKTTYCKILEDLVQVPSYYGLTANFTLKPGKTLSPEKCNSPIDFIYMSFRPNYTVDGWWGEFRTVIALDLRDPITGKSILDLYDYFISSTYEFCPDWANLCYNDPDGGTTIYGVFDLKDQIYKIFGKSKIDQIVNISAIEDFKFWQSVAFWTVVGFSIWFLLSFYWLYVKHPTYCALAAKKSISQKPIYSKTNFFFWLIHPLIGIYLYNDPKTTKATRFAMYYQRLVVVMVFSTIFSSISKGEGAVFRAYIILFNACTVIPINSLFNRIFGWTFKLKISKKKSVSNIKNSLAILLYTFFLSACFIGIFIIEAQQDESQNKQWAINFAISFLQDLTLSPLINFIIKIFLLKLSLSKKTTKLKRTRKSITFLLQNFRSIYILIFESSPTPNEYQAQTPTEIASPLSTSRKLLKLSTLDSASPTLSKPPAKRVFKTRRASDTQMGNVDSVAVETLVTDRLQTLFSEGKTERVKPLKLIKENFERMQSANIASKFSTSSRIASVENPRGLRVTSERKLVNLTSIILSPLDPFSESVEIEPENEVFSPDGSPLEGKRNSRKNDETPKRCETVI